MNVSVDLDLEERCWSCGGNEPGQEPYLAKSDGSCGYCDGSGWKATELGNKLLDFLERRGLTTKGDM